MGTSAKNIFLIFFSISVLLLFQSVCLTVCLFVQVLLSFFNISPFLFFFFSTCQRFGDFNCIHLRQTHLKRTQNGTKVQISLVRRNLQEYLKKQFFFLQNFFSTPLATDIGLVQQREALKHICRQNRLLLLLLLLLFLLLLLLLLFR